MVSETPLAARRLTGLNQAHSAANDYCRTIDFELMLLVRWPKAMHVPAVTRRLPRRDEHHAIVMDWTAAVRSKAIRPRCGRLQALAGTDPGKSGE